MDHLYLQYNMVSRKKNIKNKGYLLLAMQKYLHKKGIQNGTESMDASSYVYLKKVKPN
jgi:hypothetical protein